MAAESMLLAYLIMDNYLSSDDDLEFLCLYMLANRRTRTHLASMCRAVLRAQRRVRKFDRDNVVRAFLNSPEENDSGRVAEILSSAATRLQMNDFTPSEIERIKNSVSLLIRRKMLGDPDIRTGVLQVVLGAGCVDLLRELLSRDQFSLAETTYELQPVFVHLYQTYLRQRKEIEQQNGSVSEEKDREVSGCLRLAIEAGLSTQLRPEVHRHWDYAYNFYFVDRAAREGHIELMKLMYTVGATNYRELSSLSRLIERWPFDYQHRTAEVRECVDQMVHAPRSLQDLCRLEVSYLIGCRADRKHRALSLGLPLHLTKLVLFHDVLQ